MRHSPLPPCTPGLPTFPATDLFAVERVPPPVEHDLALAAVRRDVEYVVDLVEHEGAGLGVDVGDDSRVGELDHDAVDECLKCEMSVLPNIGCSDR